MGVSVQRDLGEGGGGRCILDPLCVSYFLSRLWKKRRGSSKDIDISTVFSGERNRSHYRQYSRRDVTTTEVGMDWEMVDQNH